MMTRMIRYELRDLNQRTFFVQMPAQTALKALSLGIPDATPLCLSQETAGHLLTLLAPFVQEGRLPEALDASA